MINILNIIISLYKGKEVLPDCLNSLISQTKKNFFVTLIQDCDGDTVGNKPIIFHEAFDNWINRMCGEKII